MNKNYSPFAIVEIGGGIICLLIGVSGFLQYVDFVLILQNLFLGAGLLLYGMTDNNKDKSARGKMLSNIASIFMIIVGVLSLYNYFDASK